MVVQYHVKMLSTTTEKSLYDLTASRSEGKEEEEREEGGRKDAPPPDWYGSGNDRDTRRKRGRKRMDYGRPGRFFPFCLLSPFDGKDWKRDMIRFLGLFGNFPVNFLIFWVLVFFFLPPPCSMWEKQVKGTGGERGWGKSSCVSEGGIFSPLKIGSSSNISILFSPHFLHPPPFPATTKHRSIPFLPPFPRPKPDPSPKPLAVMTPREEERRRKHPDRLSPQNVCCRAAFYVWGSGLHAFPKENIP